MIYSELDFNKLGLIGRFQTVSFSRELALNLSLACGYNLHHEYTSRIGGNFGGFKRSLYQYISG